jgi:transcription elongation factor GreA|tara:strand:- start:668 stop:1198 length:531 start_codon:yes stop_codon:yes gene_type:complete
VLILSARDAFVFKGDKDIMSKVPMTVIGADQLRKELVILKFDRRPKITEAIASARELGDLKENAEYHAAREDQGICEARIRDIEGKLSNAQIIDVTTLDNTGRIIFGTTVTILNLDTDAEVTYRIVGDDEAEIKQNLISVNSPIARGLIGKSEGDEVSITTPGGLTDYEIVAVKYI